MGSSGRLMVDSMVNIGPHYARTLREWKRNFVDSWEETIAPALVRKYNLTAAEQEVFRRKWICELNINIDILGAVVLTEYTDYL